MEKLYKNKEWIFEHYVNRKLSMEKIAKICGCKKTTIHNWINKYNIKNWNYQDINWLTEQHWGNDLTISEMAEKARCNTSTIQKWMDKYNIPRKNIPCKNSMYKNKEWLIEQYCNNKLTLQEMGNLIDCSFSVIRDWMDIYNIPRRERKDVTDKTRKKQSKSSSGKINPMWKGGKIKQYKRGYILILSPGHPFRNSSNYVMQHRLVAEESLRKYFPTHPGLIEIDGIKYLRKDWVAHHKDEITDNNVWSNLFVMSVSSHTRFHHLGNKHSEETKRKMSLHRHSEQSKNKMTLSIQLNSSTSENDTLISEWGF